MAAIVFDRFIQLEVSVNMRSLKFYIHYYLLASVVPHSGHFIS
jgi:hypothetical protein